MVPAITTIVFPLVNEEVRPRDVREIALTTERRVDLFPNTLNAIVETREFFEPWIRRNVIPQQKLS